MDYEQHEDRKEYLSPKVAVLVVLGDVLLASNEAMDNQFDDDFLFD